MALTSLDFQKQSLRNKVARDLQFSGYEYYQTITTLQSISLFDNWDSWELQNRPVNLEEIKEILNSCIGDI